ncbi:dTDP-glucose 4,6-dehydratase 2, partial [Haemophilus influenzae]
KINSIDDFKCDRGKNTAYLWRWFAN